jgi:mannose-1-phosphate guanylyltransferase
MQESDNMGIFKFKRSLMLRPLKKMDNDESKGFNYLFYNLYRTNFIVRNNKKFIKAQKNSLKNDIC